MFKYNVRSEAARNMGSSVFLTPEEIVRVKENNAIVGSSVHPDTNEIMPHWQRLSGFVIFNFPIVFAVLFIPNQTPLFNAGMQWINQTYNAAMNYGNRNASSPYTTSDLARGYAGAVAVSVSIAMTSRRMLASQLKQFKGAKLIILNALLNYLAGATAGASNLVLMRYKEIESGITVTNEKGDKEFGKSKAAGKKAIQETAISRFVLPLPVLFFPAVGNFILEKLRLWPKNMKLSKLIELSLCICSLSFALPMSIALFQQQACLTRDQIDEEFRELRLEGEGTEEEPKYVEKFYFNKGL